MDVLLRYTTVEAIARRLKGRLDQSVSPTALGRAVLDTELVQQVGEQAEARLDAVLSQIYQLPLKGVHPILAEYVELRCVCSMIPIHFQRQNVSDDRGLGNLACSEAEKLLAQLEADTLRLSGEARIAGEVVRDGAPTLVVKPAPRTTQQFGIDQEPRPRGPIKNAEEIRW